MLSATLANAAVTFDDTSVVTVDKGDVQTLVGWNDKTWQAKVGDVRFTSKYRVDSTDVWSCSDGSTQSRIRIDENKGGTYLSGTRIGAPYVGYCPTGGFTGFLPHEFTNTVIPGA